MKEYRVVLLSKLNDFAGSLRRIDNCFANASQDRGSLKLLLALRAASASGRQLVNLIRRLILPESKESESKSGLKCSQTRRLDAAQRNSNLVRIVRFKPWLRMLEASDESKRSLLRGSTHRSCDQSQSRWDHKEGGANSTEFPAGSLTYSERPRAPPSQWTSDSIGIPFASNRSCQTA